MASASRSNDISSGSEEQSSDSNFSASASSDSSESDNSSRPTVRKRTKTVPVPAPDIVWKQRDIFPRRFGFSANAGVATADLDASSTTLEIFLQFFPDELFQHIAEQTNKYAADNNMIKFGQPRETLDQHNRRRDQSYGVVGDVDGHYDQAIHPSLLDERPNDAEPVLWQHHAQRQISPVAKESALQRQRC